MARTPHTHARTAAHVAGTTGRTTTRTTSRSARRALAVAGFAGLATLASAAPALAFQPVPGPGDIALPPVGVTVSGPAQVDEDQGVAFYTVQLTGIPTGTVTVGYTTAEGSALAGSDYGSTASSIWLDDTTPTIIGVPIVSDDLDEVGEQFGFGISVLGGNVDVVGSGVVVTTIVDDDVPQGPGDIAQPEPQPDPDPQPEGPGDITQPEPQPDPEPQPEGPGEIAIPEPKPEPDPHDGPDDIAIPEPGPVGPEGPDDLTADTDPGDDTPDDDTPDDDTPDDDTDEGAGDGTGDTTPGTADDTQEVAGAHAVEGETTLAFTGAGAEPLAGIGALLTGLGSAACLAVRRRRHAA